MAVCVCEVQSKANDRPGERKRKGNAHTRAHTRVHTHTHTHTHTHSGEIAPGRHQADDSPLVHKGEAESERGRKKQRRIFSHRRSGSAPRHSRAVLRKRLCGSAHSSAQWLSRAPQSKQGQRRRERERKRERRTENDARLCLSFSLSLSFFASFRPPAVQGVWRLSSAAALRTAQRRGRRRRRREKTRPPPETHPEIQTVLVPLRPLSFPLSPSSSPCSSDSAGGQRRAGREQAALCPYRCRLGRGGEGERQGCGNCGCGEARARLRSSTMKRTLVRTRFLWVLRRIYFMCHF